MRIINVSKEPYEWTWDAKTWGPLQPGEIRDFPTELAEHAIKRSVILDDEGIPVTYRVEAYDATAGRHLEMATFSCPYKLLGQCESPPLKTQEDLRRHLDTHWQKGQAAKVAPSAGARQ